MPEVRDDTGRTQVAGNRALLRTTPAENWLGGIARPETRMYSAGIVREISR